MRLSLPFAIAMAVASIAATGCTATGSARSAASTAADSDAAGTPSTGKPMGKIAADQVGKVSPVPAFMGGGEHWSIDIQATGDMNHRVQLTWGSGSQKASGQLAYRGQPADAPRTLIVLSGELATAQGAKPMTVEIRDSACTDDGDRPHRHSVQVTVEGLQQMRGCGDLAVY